MSRISPFEKFRIWYKEAVETGEILPDAMCLSTVNKDGKPSSRMVLLKEIREPGFVFFTNYHSRKAFEITNNPYVCLNFHWPKAERQVRIEGEVHKTTGEISDAYFTSRPRESQLGAWASSQSQLMADKSELDKIFRETELKFKDQNIPRPPHWGGYQLIPERIEFWQGKLFRLHERELFIKQDNGIWKVQYLYP